MKNVYIATKFEDVKQYHLYKDKLEKVGYNITVDWTQHEKVHPFSNHKELCLKQSVEDCEGIKQADFILLIYNGKKGSGMSFELGYATALNKTIYMISINENATMDYSMFVHMKNFKHCKDFDDLIKKVEE